MTDAQSGWPQAPAEPNVPVAGGCEEGVYGVVPYQPCNRRAEVFVAYPGHEGSWRYCRQCADNRTGITILGEYTVGDYVDPNSPTASATEVQPTTEAPSWGQSAEAAHVAVPETEEAKKRRLVAEVQDWTEAKALLADAKEKESAARLALTSTCFPTPVKGTQRFALDGGYNVKLVFGYTFTLGDKDKSDGQGGKISIYDQVVALERDIMALGPEGKLLVERLIKWKPELSATEYEALARDTASEVEVQAKALIDEILTVKPASPQLTLEEPKPAK